MKVTQEIVETEFKKSGFILVDKYKNNELKLKAICFCGRTFTTTRRNLVHNKPKSCGCYKSAGLNHYKFKGTGEISLTYFNRMKSNAFHRNIDFKINIEQLWDLFLKQKRKCALSGMDIIFSTRGDKKNTPTASLDRIDSSKGYEIDNIQWAHKDINRMKMDMRQDKFINLCQTIAKFNEV